jgi:hypothetical protein
MLNKIARGAFLLFLAVMIVSWAMTVGKSSPLEPQPPLPTDRMYS